MPVLPLVGSMMIVSGPIRPSFSAAHRHADAVLDAVRGIEGLELGDDLGRGAFGQAAQPHERRIADQLGDVIGDVHRASTPV